MPVDTRKSGLSARAGPNFSNFSAVESVAFARQVHAAVLMHHATVLIFGSKRDNVQVIESGEIFLLGGATTTTIWRFTFQLKR